MPQLRHHKGPWAHRLLVGLFSVATAVLCFWLLGFIVDDLGTWPGPVYRDLENRLLDRNLIEGKKALEEQLAETERKISRQSERQALLRDSTTSSQTTMNQLLEFQRLSLEKNVTPSTEEQQALAESQRLFLANQQEYQTLNEEIVLLKEQLQDLKDEQRLLDDQLEQQRQPVYEEFSLQQRRHRIKIAAVKLTVLIPLLIVAVILFLRQRGKTYAPLVYAFGIATLLRVALVMHEYFPAPYFRYILILAVLGLVIRILVYLLRMIAFPQADWLLKQYQEAYEVFLCPICSHPIRRGPLKYLFWTRRTLKKMRTATPADTGEEETYTCPACSTALYEKCEQCGKVRHSLLPTCHSCGDTRPIDVNRVP